MLPGNIAFSEINFKIIEIDFIREYGSQVRPSSRGKEMITKLSTWRQMSLASATFAIFTFATPALAQQADADDDGGYIEEIITTGTAGGAEIRKFDASFAITTMSESDIKAALRARMYSCVAFPVAEMRLSILCRSTERPFSRRPRCRSSRTRRCFVSTKRFSVSRRFAAVQTPYSRTDNPGSRPT
jgi:hypothetical protein